MRQCATFFLFFHCCLVTKLTFIPRICASADTTGRHSPVFRHTKSSHSEPKGCAYPPYSICHAKSSTKKAEMTRCRDDASVILRNRIGKHRSV
ncbi:hypothetical protein FB451DRAFT_1280693 [Mycena latifolia]|nr:hypothetical protein FB451DRAFT_1280693 [Mycena latifolia]